MTETILKTYYIHVHIINLSIHYKYTEYEKTKY